MSRARQRRRWLAWVRYWEHYMAPGITAGGRGAMQTWNHAARRRWLWP